MFEIDASAEKVFHKDPLAPDTSRSSQMHLLEKAFRIMQHHNILTDALL